MGLDFISHPDQVALSLDVRGVLEQLTPEQREICERLTRQSLEEIVGEMGLSRRTLVRRIDEVREQFRAAGFSGDG